MLSKRWAILERNKAWSACQGLPALYSVHSLRHRNPGWPGCLLTCVWWVDKIFWPRLIVYYWWKKDWWLYEVTGSYELYHWKLPTLKKRGLQAKRKKEENIQCLRLESLFIILSQFKKQLTVAFYQNWQVQFFVLWLRLIVTTE